MSSLPVKRSASRLSPHFDATLRQRFQANNDDDKNLYASTALSDNSDVSFLPARHGQEVLSLTPSLKLDLRHENVNDLILETTARLASEGKRLVKAPRLLPDGIAFDWVCDATARNEDMRNLLSVEGIRTGDLGRVLDRAAHVSGGSSHVVTEEVPMLNRPNLLSCLTSKQQAHSLAPPRNASAGDASNPIVIQDDMEDDIAPGAVSKCEEHQQQPDRPPQCEVAAMPRYSDDLSHATRHCKTPVSAAATQYGIPTVIQPSHISFEENRSSAALSHSSVNDPIQESGAPTSTRAAYYGEWKVLANDSSDAEMEDGHQSSRESSVARSLPPQPTHHVLPGLPFLPQTYDTSSLFSQQSSTSIPCPYRTGVHGETISSRSERERSTPPRVPVLPSRTSYRTLNEALEYSSNRTATDSMHPPRRASRQKASQHVQSSDHSEDDSDGEPTNKVRVSQETPPRSKVASHNLRRNRSGGTIERHQDGRIASAASSHARPRLVRRSAVSETSDRNGSRQAEELEDEQVSASATTSGHTVVIPKAEYARGRRLLAPSSPNHPLTTILMRGEAHFVDQQQKVRISTNSLPVEDDTRHVEDACLIGDDMIVVGYNKGPCQVSLITVREDQRPSRIDLSHKAHSTVIENRALGKSYPNPGIACLAPVARDTFLSGGHDKTVHRWTIARSSRNGDRGGFSARSVRIPTDHTHSVQALAYCAWSNMVYSAAGDRISTTKLAALAHTEPERVSGKVTQVHVHPQDPRLIALEIDHMDYQVHLYDMREGGFQHRPWLEFGYRAAVPKTSRASANSSRSASNSVIPKVGSRYTRGSTMHSFFARGYGDGVVLVWDYRNGAQKKVLERFQFQRPAEVVHTVLAGSDVIAYGGYSVTFWSTLAARV